MGRASRRKKEPRPPPPVSPQSNWTLKKVAALVSAVVASVGLIASALALQSKFLVSVQEAFEPDNADSIPIEFINDSPYAVDWIRHDCELHEIHYRDGTTMGGLRSSPIFHRRERLSPGQGRTVFCFVSGKELKINAVDLGLRVTYKPWFIPIEQAKEYRFEITRDPTGKFRAMRRNSSDDHQWTY
jgi:hypothetical protein